MAIIVQVPDGSSIETTVVEARKAWVKATKYENESLRHFAERVGVAYRTVLRWTQGEYAGSTIARSLIKSTLPVSCEFCHSEKDVHSHHVINRHDSPVTVKLCALCHTKFHFLNRLYRQPKAR